MNLLLTLSSIAKIIFLNEDFRRFRQQFLLHQRLLLKMVVVIVQLNCTFDRTKLNLKFVYVKFYSCSILHLNQTFVNLGHWTDGEFEVTCH